MGHIADIVLGDYLSTQKNAFNLVDSKYIYEEDGEKILSVTDELIDELVNSDIPNHDFVPYLGVDENGNPKWYCKYSSIIGNRVLVRRGYPCIEDVIKDIFSITCLGVEDEFNGLGELQDVIASIPKETQAEYIKVALNECLHQKYTFGSKEYEETDYNTLYEWIEYMRLEKITKAIFNDDGLWEEIKNILQGKRKHMKETMEKWVIDIPCFQVEYDYHNSLIEFMENNE